MASADEEEDDDLRSMQGATAELPQSSATNRKRRHEFKSPPQEENDRSNWVGGGTTEWTPLDATIMATPRIQSTLAMDDGPRRAVESLSAGSVDDGPAIPRPVDASLRRAT